MVKINNMRELREKVLSSLEELEKGTIDIAELTTIAKISETIVAGLKSEMQYSILTNRIPNIKFYEYENTNVISYDTKKAIER